MLGSSTTADTTIKESADFRDVIVSIKGVRDRHTFILTEHSPEGAQGMQSMDEELDEDASHDRMRCINAHIYPHVCNHQVRLCKASAQHQYQRCDQVVHGETNTFLAIHYPVP